MPSSSILHFRALLASSIELATMTLTDIPVATNFIYTQSRDRGECSIPREFFSRSKFSVDTAQGFGVKSATAPHEIRFLSQAADLRKSQCHERVVQHSISGGDDGSGCKPGG